MMKWLATKFVGKKTYAAIGLLLVKEIAEMLGVQITDDMASNAIDVVLLLLAGVFRATAKQEVRDERGGDPAKLPDAGFGNG